MAIIVRIDKNESKKTMQKKVDALALSAPASKKFNASKYTGKIKSFGDGLSYQKK